MATYFVDLINGNDANNGTTFALRKKTLYSASTGKNASDTIRVMKSPDPTSIGSCTWSNSRTITLPSAYNASITESKAADWTVSANTSKAATTGVGEWRIGASGALSLTIAAAFTTGKAAYAICDTPDLSAYQQISFFLGNSLAIAANSMYIDLCSDSTGDVPIISLLVPNKGTSPSNISTPITLNNGAPLPNNVNSIAIRFTVDPGAINIKLSNMIAVPAASSNTSLTLNSVIGLKTENEPEWYPIYSISGTTVTLDIAQNWVGSAGSLETFKLEPIRFDQLGAIIPNSGSSSIANWVLQGGGSTTTGYLNIEFGWDETDMSVQSGYTAVDFINNAGRSVDNAVGFTSVNKFISIRPYCGFGSSNSSFKYGEYHVVNSYVPTFISQLTAQYYIDKFYATSHNSNIVANNQYPGSLIANEFSIKYTSYSTNSSSGTSYYTNALNDLYIKKFTFNGGRSNAIGCGSGLIENYYFNGSNSTLQSSLAVNQQNNIVTNLKIKNFISQSTVTNLVNFTSGSYSEVYIENYSFTSAPTNNATFTSSTLGKNKLLIQNYNNSGIFQGYGDYFSLTSVSTPVHTAGGKAWEFKITSTNSTYYQLESNYYKINNYKFVNIPVKANKLVTVSLWTQRKFTTTKAAIFVKPEVSGISDYVITESSAAANTWEQITITFTPTVNSVVPIYIGAQYDSVNASQAFYFDDLSVTIAD